MKEQETGVDLETPKYRIQRRFYDRVTGRVYDRLADIERKLAPNPAAIRTFLRIGYVPGTATLFEGVDCLPGGCRLVVGAEGWRVKERFQTPPPRAEGDWTRLREEGARLFVAAVHRAAAAQPEVLVPLSGGMDSRAILAALLEVLPAWKINTYTHGTIGANDFELGNLVARRVGTRHVSIDLDQVPFTYDALATAAVWSDANTDLAQPAVWHRVAEIFGTSVPQWTGFTGDGLGGSHYRPPRAVTMTEAVEAYLNEEAVHYDWVDRNEPWREEAALVATETAYDRSLGRHEAVWFDNHVERYTTHHIFMNALSFVNPFMDDEFASFMLSLPSEWRDGKRFFDDMVRSRFPKLFGLPTKSEGWHQGGVRQAGWRLEQAARKAAWRIAPSRFHHPMMSYLDFGEALRRRDDVSRLAAELLTGLARRGVVDGREVLRRWKSHRAGAADHRYVLTLLMSLEVALRVFSDAEGPRRAPSSSGA
ncbi:MAG: asparagine synthase-related protein [Myxococcota bacterium]